MGMGALYDGTAGTAWHGNGMEGKKGMGQGPAKRARINTPKHVFSILLSFSMYSPFPFLSLSLFLTPPFSKLEFSIHFQIFVSYFPLPIIYPYISPSGWARMRRSIVHRLGHFPVWFESSSHVARCTTT
ncbi:hypothetical protein BDY21DRAFT_351443 [Lineolata rhizophorae]|uniref:Uncharacterized protein n=1 Tax=Lineolata rhizophorae TaxID=578093 RepID=A0A6A6NTV2_9PEZI|nr:hypothetical protein BDY21DRAFT_351443 [Lineolata rhizophorae]